jgi:hypothetical protein
VKDELETSKRQRAKDEMKSSERGAKNRREAAPSDAKKPAARQAFFLFPSKFRIPNLENKLAKKDRVILTVHVARRRVASQVTFVRLDSFSTFGVER